MRMRGWESSGAHAKTRADGSNRFARNLLSRPPGQQRSLRRRRHWIAPRRAPGEKVSLFRTLFRGRTDVFPVRFVSKRTGKPGYAPACSNKWEPGLCLLRTGGRCSDCINQAFVPVSDQVVVDHLQGRHAIGVYPLLDDDNCWFLAVDFDKNSWKEDLVAFAETCRSVGTPVAIERSRSGNGAHAWFFSLHRCPRMWPGEWAAISSPRRCVADTN